MTATELRNHWRATPFVPFTIMGPAGIMLPVPERDYLSVSPRGRFAHVWKQNDESTFLEVQKIIAVRAMAS